ncbi:MAG: HNH endonuclease signature motif containing protein [bacterium]|jgi:hypothetical protein
MENVICDFCGKKFKRKRSQIKLAIKHFCSAYCSDQGRRRGKMIKCFVCGKSVYKSLKDLNISKSKKYFCGHICGNKWIGEQQRAENNPNWDGGASSYKELLKRTGIKKECVLCGKDDTRILCAHHLDKNRRNNKMENLIWLCRNCHFLVHNYKKEII